MWHKRGSTKRQTSKRNGSHIGKGHDICRASEITSNQMKALNEEVNVHKVESIKPKKRDSDEKRMQQMQQQARVQEMPSLRENM